MLKKIGAVIVVVGVLVILSVGAADLGKEESMMKPLAYVDPGGGGVGG